MQTKVYLFWKKKLSQTSRRARRTISKLIGCPVKKEGGNGFLA
jgi:phage terminase Nu1 subunit (DNA packaging protein)